MAKGKNFTIRLSPGELQCIVAAADSSTMPRSAWVRHQALRAAEGASKPPALFQAPSPGHGYAKLTRVLGARFTEQQLEAIGEHARACGLTLSGFIRQLVLGFKPIARRDGPRARSVPVSAPAAPSSLAATASSSSAMTDKAELSPISRPLPTAACAPLLGASNRERTQAIHGVPTLTGRLDAYQRAVGGLHAAKQAFRAQAQQLASPSVHSQPQARTADRTLPGPDQARALSSHLPSPAQIRSEMARVTATLRTLHQASHGAQDAIETAIRGMGSSAVDSALLLLPPEVAMPVNLAVRAVAHAIERTLDLGQGLELGLGR